MNSITIKIVRTFEEANKETEGYFVVAKKGIDFPPTKIEVKQPKDIYLVRNYVANDLIYINKPYTKSSPVLGTAQLFESSYVFRARTFKKFDLTKPDPLRHYLMTQKYTTEMVPQLGSTFKCYTPIAEEETVQTSF